MHLESAVRFMAGALVLLSLLLFQLFGAWALLLALFVGLNLVQSAFTGFCPAEKILGALGIGARRGSGTGAGGRAS